jgi:hypothetical protein
MRNVSAKAAEEIKTQTLCLIPVHENPAVYEIIRKYMQHVLCMLDN